MTAPDLPRRAPRFATDATILVGEGDDAIAGKCMNLSSGGLCSELVAGLNVEVPHQLRLSLIFDTDVESEPLALSARAVWCTQIGEVWQVGFQFLPLDKDQSSFLQMFLRYLDGGA